MNWFTIVATCFITSHLIWSIVAEVSDNKFVKRYALMKLYEACFGPEVVKEVRREMKIASLKCSRSMPSGTVYSNFVGFNKLKVASTSSTSPILQMNRQVPDSLLSTEHLKSQILSNVDLNKLNQAILAGYNKQLSQQSSHSTSPRIQSVFEYSQYPRLWNSIPNQNAGSSYYPQNGGLIGPHTTGPGFLPTSVAHPLNSFYPSYFPPFYHNGRISKDLDIRSQLESLVLKMSGKIRNITCVMQELGYLNENLEPDYERMVDRIMDLPISEDLKQDISQGIEYCKQFSLCIPDVGKQKFAKEVLKPMFFFRCYKHKKMEACIMKDLKERYSSEISNDNLVSIDRSDKSKHSLNDFDVMELGANEFIYDNGGTDPDMFL